MQHLYLTRTPMKFIRRTRHHIIAVILDEQPHEFPLGGARPIELENPLLRSTLRPYRFR
jgi:hypothetical protein